MCLPKLDARAVPAQPLLRLLARLAVLLAGLAALPAGLGSAPAFGQDAGAPMATAEASPPAVTSPSAKLLEPRVVAARPLEPQGLRRGLMLLDDTLVVQVQGLTDWLGSNSCGDVRLFLDGLLLEELRPRRCVLEKGEVWFLLRRIDRAREPAWKELLASRQGLGTLADVSLGLRDEPPLPTDVQDDTALPLAIADFHVIVGAIAFLVVTFLGFLVLAQRTALLRQMRNSPILVRQRPYSLARVQVAWWFFLVLASFLLISILVGDMAEIPSSVLGLLGIASGTYLGAEVIDRGKLPPAGRPGGVASAVPTETSAPVTPVPRTTHGVLEDLLSDASGIAFYRFQIFVWTLVLGWFFISSVWRNLAMPDLPTSVLGLMGISGGTFLGMKLPEKSADG